MGAWKQSKPLTDKSWALVKENPDLATFPVTAAVAGLLGGALFVLPGIALMVALDSTVMDVVGGVLIAVGMLVGTSLAMLEIGALVAGADRLLHGQPAPKDECRAQAREHAGAIVGWAVLNLIVGTIIQAIQGGGDNSIGVTIVRTILASVAAVAWALITFFMMPLIVLEGLGTFAALKRSAQLIRERWGKAVLGGIRIGLKFFLILILPGLLLGAGGVALWAFVGGGIGVGFGALLVVVGLVLVLIGSVLTTTVRNIFGVALYRWADTGEAVGPFSEAELASAVKVKEKKK